MQPDEIPYESLIQDPTAEESRLLGVLKDASWSFSVFRVSEGRVDYRALGPGPVGEPPVRVEGTAKTRIGAIQSVAKWVVVE